MTRRSVEHAGVGPPPAAAAGGRPGAGGEVLGLAVQLLSVRSQDSHQARGARALDTRHVATRVERGSCCGV